LTRWAVAASDCSGVDGTFRKATGLFCVMGLIDVRGQSYIESQDLIPLADGGADIFYRFNGSLSKFATHEVFHGLLGMGCRWVVVYEVMIHHGE